MVKEVLLSLVNHLASVVNEWLQPIYICRLRTQLIRIEHKVGRNRKEDQKEYERQLKLHRITKPCARRLLHIALVVNEQQRENEVDHERQNDDEGTPDVDQARIVVCARR